MTIFRILVLEDQCSNPVDTKTKWFLLFCLRLGRQSYLVHVLIGGERLQVPNGIVEVPSSWPRHHLLKIWIFEDSYQRHQLVRDWSFVVFFVSCICQCICRCNFVNKLVSSCFFLLCTLLGVRIQHLERLLYVKVRKGKLLFVSWYFILYYIE